jgi:hypothetical protein
MDHNLKAAVMWDGGGRMYDDISRSLASTTCVTRLQPEPDEQNASHRDTVGTARVARSGAQVTRVDIAEGVPVGSDRSRSMTGESDETSSDRRLSVWQASLRDHPGAVQTAFPRPARHNLSRWRRSDFESNILVSSAGPLDTQETAVLSTDLLGHEELEIASEPPDPSRIAEANRRLTDPLHEAFQLAIRRRDVASAAEVLLVMGRICERERQRRKQCMDRRHGDPLLSLARRQLDELRASQRAS